MDKLMSPLARAIAQIDDDMRDDAGRYAEPIPEDLEKFCVPDPIQLAQLIGRTIRFNWLKVTDNTAESSEFYGESFGTIIGVSRSVARKKDPDELTDIDYGLVVSGLVVAREPVSFLGINGQVDGRMVWIGVESRDGAMAEDTCTIADACYGLLYVGPDFTQTIEECCRQSSKS